MENVFWTGYCNGERYSTINRIKSVITKFGDLVDFKLFSDVSLALKIELEELKIDNLYEELSRSIEIDKFEYIYSISKRERTVYLNITFTKGTGNLIIETPSVPG